MAQLSIAFCKQLAKARREKGMTQSALAEAVGCKQSAISMLEAGHSAKVAQETVGRIAALLDVPMPQPPHSQLPTADCQLPTADCLPPAAPHAFCPSALCHSNVPYVADGVLLFWPRPQPDGAEGGTRCTVCGELLERRCPHCGAAVRAAGACCPACGGARVTDTLPPETDREAWAARRRREIAEWRSLIL
jgi:DNA-binding XRE family transcriptional regulator